LWGEEVKKKKGWVGGIFSLWIGDSAGQGRGGVRRWRERGETQREGKNTCFLSQMGGFGRLKSYEETSLGGTNELVGSTPQKTPSTMGFYY